MGGRGVGKKKTVRVTVFVVKWLGMSIEGEIKVPLRQCFHGLVALYYWGLCTFFVSMLLKDKYALLSRNGICREYALFWSRFYSILFR